VNTDKFAKAICAFANDLPNKKLPGYLMVGAYDNGTLSGLKVTDEMLRNLAGLRSDGNIQPKPALMVEKISFSEGDLAVVEVIPSKNTPVKYKGVIYVRIGPRKAEANEEEERILREKSEVKCKPTDKYILPCKIRTITFVGKNEMEKLKEGFRTIRHPEGMALIEKYYRSGQRPMAYCKEQGITECQFYGWRRRYLKFHPEAEAMKKKENSIHPVMIEPKDSMEVSGFEIYYPHGVRVVIGNGESIEIEKLKALIKLRV